MLEKAMESVKVVVRCRPMNTRERDLNCKGVLLMDSDRCNCSLVNPEDASAPPKTFSFDSVYNIACPTEQLYNEMVYPLVEGVLEGYNATIFAYGQTGCGKSFTMQGTMSPPSSRGITPRSFEHIFEAIATTENAKFLVVASYLEIYNEDIRDLLGADSKKRLELKENPTSGVYVPDLSKHTVQSVADCDRLMETGWRNRATGATLMNADSSRSHSIFTISLEMMGRGGGIKRGKLNLVDLAGSERQGKTGATGDRLKEATKINLSLMALGNVISALVDGRSKHIPYRDSKLTRLLQDSLGGNTKTLMIACLSPADNNYDETLSTLRYANRAKNIRNKPRINEDPKDAMLREYQKEIENLKQLLQAGQLPDQELHQNNNNQNVQLTLAHQETEKIRRDFENEMLRLKEGYEREQKTKQKLQEEMDELKRSYEQQMERLQENDGEGGFNVVNVSQQQVIERLKKLQESMIGGERAGDKELKEKRLKKKKAAEKRLEALAAVLARVKDEDGVMLRVYDDIQDELKAKTETLKKYKQRIRGMEREISDLQGEFENERTDYLETIRRGERQIQLYQQIAEKMTTVMKRECNYSHLDKVKQECVWSDELEQWRIPELIIPRTKLPPAGGAPHSNWTTLVERAQKQNMSSDTTKDDLNFGNWNNLSERLSSGSSSDSSTMSRLQRLERSEVEDLAGNYFKPRRANMLLSKAREDASKAFSTWKDYVTRCRGKPGSSDPTHGSLNSLNLLGSGGTRGDDSRGSLNNSWSGGWGNGGARPARLDALPALTGLHKPDTNILQLM